MNVILKAGLFGLLAIGAVAGASQLDWRKPEPSTPPNISSRTETRAQPAPPIAAAPDISKTDVQSAPKGEVQQNQATASKATRQKAPKKQRKRRPA